jgi:hypothetical protein
MFDNPDGIPWLGYLRYPVAIIALTWGITSGLILAWALNSLALSHTLGIVLICGVVGGIVIGLSLRRWPPPGL